MGLFCHIVRCQFRPRKLTGVILLRAPTLPSFFSSFSPFYLLRLLTPLRRFRWQNIIKMQIGSFFHPSAQRRFCSLKSPRIRCEDLWGEFGRKDSARDNKGFGKKRQKSQVLVFSSPC